MLNGFPGQAFSPQRGLHQGDPLSPYLFVICTEGFSTLLQQAVEANELSGLRACRAAPKVSHLFFADDTLIFSKATIRDCEGILNALHKYGEASGQHINFTKSSILFSPNVSQQIQEDILDLTEIRSVVFTEKYLGLPSMVGRAKNNSFQSLKDRIWKRIQGWKEKSLSKGGKEILIKAVAQAIPTYSMSCFKIPTSLCKELESLMAKFWWGDQSNNRKIHWVSWEKMCWPKDAGGLGFKDLQSFNLAMLAKQAWRLMTNEDSLVARILKARYFANTNFMEAHLGSNPSYTWRSLLEGRGVLEKGTFWRVVNDLNIRISESPWVPNAPSYRVHTNNLAPENLRWVNQLILENPKRWNKEVINQFLTPNLLLKFSIFH